MPIAPSTSCAAKPTATNRTKSPSIAPPGSQRAVFGPSVGAGYARSRARAERSGAGHDVGGITGQAPAPDCTRRVPGQLGAFVPYGTPEGTPRSAPTAGRRSSTARQAPWERLVCCRWRRLDST